MIIERVFIEIDDNFFVFAEIVSIIGDVFPTDYLIITDDTELKCDGLASFDEQRMFSQPDRIV